jgi:uncharacterized protein YbaR (Trm112 family)
MAQNELLRILVCPIDHTSLSAADDRLVAEVNHAIAAGRVTNRAGRPVDQFIGGGLIHSEKTLLYPIREGIPVLLADEAIPLGQIG